MDSRPTPDPLFVESPSGVVILDETATIVDVNPAGCHAFTRKREDLAGVEFLRLVHDADRDRVEGHLRAVLGGDAAEWRARLRRGDGLPRLHRHRGVPLPARNRNGRLAIFLRSGQAEDLGRPDIPQLQSLLENLPGQFVLTTDKAGKIRHSSGLERTHFLPASSVLGAPYGQLLGGEREGEESLQELLEAVNAGRPWAGLQWHRRKDGPSFPARVFAAPHRDPGSGQLLGILLVGQDDSATHRWRDQAERAEPLAQIGSLSTGIARKIAEALSSLENTVEALTRLEGGAGTEGGAIRAEIVHFRKFLEAVAEFGNRGTIRRGLHPLPDILAHVLEELQPRIEALGLVPELTTPSDLPPVYADRTYLSRILDILLENALDAGESATAPFLRMEISDGTDGVLLTITNASAVLPEEWLQEIFDPFFTTKEGRPGLGLAVAQGMVRAHDGRLWAEMPEPGALRLSLELPKEAPERVRDYRPVPLNLSRSRRVLLVDEDEEGRQVTRGFLEKLGYQVQEAWSGRSAVAQITNGQLPEIVITDLSVTDGSGAWFLEQLQDISPRLLPRTVLLTDDPEFESWGEVGQAKGCPIVRKPIEPLELLEILDKVALGP